MSESLASCLVQDNCSPTPTGVLKTTWELPSSAPYTKMARFPSMSLLAREGSNSEDLQEGNTSALHKRVVSDTSLLYLQNSPIKTNIINPCYPRNYVTTLTGGYIFDSLCTADLRPVNYDPDDIITFEGTGDPSVCREKVAFLFDFKACHDQEACSFDGVYQPKVKGAFVVRAKTTKKFPCSPVKM